MTFELEVLQADHGESLLLHYGTKSAPRLSVIDGGPAGVWNATLKKRLLAIAKGKRLAIEVLMVSHMDDDHVAGIVDMLEEMKDDADDGKPARFAIGDLWINTFEDTVAKGAPASLTGLMTATSVPEHFRSAFAASVSQARTVRDLARGLRIRQNAKFDTLVQAPDTGKKTVRLGGTGTGSVSLTVLAPNEGRIEKLRADWQTHALKKKTGAATAAALDRSVYNLSSIVVLAEQATKRMLLTGDARGDDILDGLENARLLKNDRIDVAVLKLPHHGSDRNVSTDFFRRVRAANYVISANGKFGNPDTPTLEMILAARGDRKITFWLTNRDGDKGLAKRLTTFFGKQKRGGFAVRYRAATKPSFSIAL